MELSSNPEFTTEDGVKVRLRRAGVGDIKAIQGILGETFRSAANRSALLSGIRYASTTEEALAQFFGAMDTTSDSVISWFQTMVPPEFRFQEPVKEGETLLSLTDAGQFLETLAKHKNIVDFFDSLRRLAENPVFVSLKARFSAENEKSSTSSNPSTSGETPT